MVDEKSPVEVEVKRQGIFVSVVTTYQCDNSEQAELLFGGFVRMNEALVRRDWLHTMVMGFVSATRWLAVDRA